MMTSFAFILGVLPLVVAHGAGSEMRRALGTAVFSGMLGVTLFGIFLTPVFYYVIDRVAGWKLFSTGWIHRCGRIGLDFMRLGFVRRSVQRVARFLADRARRPGPRSDGRNGAPLPQTVRPDAESGTPNHDRTPEPASVPVGSGKG
jgi:multidrug efflux pump